MNLGPSGLRAVTLPRASKPRSPPPGSRGLSHPGSSQDSGPGLALEPHVPPPGHPTFSLESYASIPDPRLSGRQTPSGHCPALPPDLCLEFTCIESPSPRRTRAPGPRPTWRLQIMPRGPWDPRGPRCLSSGLRTKTGWDTLPWIRPHTHLWLPCPPRALGPSKAPQGRVWAPGPSARTPAAIRVTRSV